MVTFTLGATIPSGKQYENAQPEVTVEADTFEEARDKALAQIQSVAAIISGKPLAELSASKPTEPQGHSVSLVEKVCALTNAKVFMNEDEHYYQDAEGNRYLSGSSFSHKYIAQFPRDMIAGKMAAKANIPVTDITDMWSLNAEASTSLGTSIHAALELYGKYLSVSKATKDGSSESALHKNPFLKQAVELFFKDREGEDARYESFIVSKKHKLCGFVDRVKIVDAEKKIVRIQDYKTNPDIHKAKTILPPFKGVIENTELDAYWLQLSFYAFIFQEAGWTVEGLDIFNIVAREQEDGSLKMTMEEYSHDVVDISAAIN